MPARPHEKLEVYRLAHALAIRVHKMTLRLPQWEMYEEGSQARRASKSITSEIVEGPALAPGLLALGLDVDDEGVLRQALGNGRQMPRRYVGGEIGRFLIVRGNAGPGLGQEPRGQHQNGADAGHSGRHGGRILRSGEEAGEAAS